MGTVEVREPGADRPLRLNGWDFGGQKVYRPTHQLFFSAPAVYLVVWKPRQGPQQGAVEYWIETILQRAGRGARILAVATHGGPGSRLPDIDEQALRDRFGAETVVGFFHVDSKPDADGVRWGIDELRQEIAELAASLPQVGRTVAGSWKRALDAVKARGRRSPTCGTARSPPSSSRRGSPRIWSSRTWG